MKPIIQKLWMVMVLLWASASALAYDFEVDGARYTITSTGDLTCMLVDVSAEGRNSFTIPEHVEYLGKTLTVNAIGVGAFENSKIEYVTFPKTITALSRRCFAGSSIKKIYPIDQITWFKNDCFRGCESLSEIKFSHEKYFTLEGGSFYGCSALKELEIPSNVQIERGEDLNADGCFEKCTALKRLSLNTTPDHDCFKDCSALTDVIIGENCYMLPISCFSGCISLSQFDIPSTIKRIYSGCFKGCTSLKNVKIPETVEFEGYEHSEYASIFNGCTSLNSVEWNAQIIPFDTFSGCTSLTSIKIGKNISKIDLATIRWNYDLGYGYYVASTTFNQTNIKTLYLEPESFSIDFNIYRDIGFGEYEQVGISEYKNFHEQFLELFNNVHTLYTGRSLKVGQIESAHPLFQNLKELIITAPYYSDCGLYNIPWKDLTYLRSECDEPPLISDSFTTEQYTSMNVYVPKGLLEKYKKADIWRNFWNLKEYDPNSGIEGIVVEEQSDPNAPIEIYNLSGVKVGDTQEGLQPGLYIKRQGNKTEKIMIK